MSARLILHIDHLLLAGVTPPTGFQSTFERALAQQLLPNAPQLAAAGQDAAPMVQQIVGSTLQSVLGSGSGASQSGGQLPPPGKGGI